MLSVGRLNSMWREPWAESGACTQVENSWVAEFFYGDTPRDRRVARDLCYSCPVREQCLQWALNKPEIWGVWGGLDEGELRRTLGVDASGHPLQRIRFPQCPACRARPSSLYILSICELKTQRKKESVVCKCCQFSWSAVTSVAAVRAYWRERKRRERELTAQRSRLRAKAARGRRLAGGPQPQVVAMFLPDLVMAAVEVSQPATVMSLAASAAPHIPQQRDPTQ